MKDFRPLSLISSIYNIAAKSLAERLKKVISKLVCGYQDVFIQGRQITDAALIANEVLGWGRKKKEKKGSFANWM